VRARAPGGGRWRPPARAAAGRTGGAGRRADGGPRGGHRLMLGHEFMRNALLAGTFVALACGVAGWFVVLRAQGFARGALGHVAFPGALAAAAAGIDARAGLFAATALAGAGIALLGRGAVARRGAGAAVSAPADDTAIAVAFTLLLALGVLFLSLFSADS